MSLRNVELFFRNFWAQCSSLKDFAVQQCRVWAGPLQCSAGAVQAQCRRSAGAVQ